MGKQQPKSQPNPQPKEEAFDWTKVDTDSINWDFIDTPEPGSQVIKQTTQNIQVPKVLSDAQLSEIEDKQIDPFLAWQPSYNVTDELADRQSKTQAFGRAIFGGIGKGGLTVLENFGYVADVLEWTGIASDMDDGETNFISDFAVNQKKELDAYHPIYSKETGDYGWYMSNLQGLVDSFVGFGVTGGGAGLFMRGMMNGAKYLNALKGMGFATEKFATTLGAAAITNYAESKMMANELWNNVYNKAIAEGIGHNQATRMASEKSQDFIINNKWNIATDFVALRGLVKGKGVITGNAERTIRQKAVDIGKDMVSEAWEEVSAGFLQKESEREAFENLGLQQRTDDSYLGRAFDYATSEEGFTEALLGAVGGPFQMVGAKGANAALTGIVDKLGISVKNDIQPPPAFTLEPPKPPADLPQDPGAGPKTPEERLKERYPKWTETQVKERAKLDKQLQFEYNEQKKDYDLKKEAYDKALEQHSTYKTDLDAYNAAKQEHEQKQAAYTEYELNKNIGKKDKAAEDIKNFLSKEAELQKSYQQAVLEGDRPKMKDLENQRFEGLFIRYGKRGSLEALEMQLKEMVADPNATKEEKEKAQNYLDKYSTYYNAYWKAFNKYSGDGLTEPVFLADMRMTNTKEVINNINKEIVDSKTELANTIANLEGTEISPVEQEYIALRAEQRELKNLEQQLRGKANPKLISELNKKTEEYQKRMDQLKTDLEQNENSHFFLRNETKSEVLKGFEEFKKLEKLASDKANAWVAFKAYENYYKYITGDKFKKDSADASYKFLNNELDKAVTSRDIEILSRQFPNFKLSKSQKATFEQALNKKGLLIAEEEKELVKEYEQKVEMQKALKEEHKELIKHLDDDYVALEFAEQNVAAAEQYGTEDSKNIFLKTRNDLRTSINRKKERIKYIEDELASPKYDFSKYNDTTSDVQFSPTDSSEGKAKPNEVLTEEKIQKVEDKASKKNDQATKDKATNAKTNKSIVDSSIADGDVIVSKTSDGDLINSEQNEIQLEKQKDPFTVAYMSNSDGVGDNQMAITDWLEIETSVNKVGTTIRFEVSVEDSFFDQEAYDAFINKKVKLTDEQISNLPIRIVVYNSEGQPLMYEGKKVYGWLRTVKSDNKFDSKNLLAARKKLVTVLQNGGNMQTSITEIGKGIFKSDEEEKDPRRFVDNVELVMSDGQTGLVKSRFKKQRNVDKRFEKTKTAAGFPFMVVQRPDGTYFPLRLNSRTVNEEESDVIYRIVESYINGYKPDQKIKNIPEISGLTYREALELLVFEGPASLKHEYPLHIDFNGKSIVFGNTTIPFTEFAKSKAEFKNYVQTMVRLTNSSLINGKLSKKFKDDFVWFGQDIDISNDYNEFLFNDGVLTTNASFHSGRAFLQPVVKIGDWTTWKLVGAESEEFITKKTPAKRKSSKKQEEQDLAYRNTSPVDNSALGEESDPITDLFGPPEDVTTKQSEKPKANKASAKSNTDAQNAFKAAVKDVNINDDFVENEDVVSKEMTDMAKEGGKKIKNTAEKETKKRGRKAKVQPEAEEKPVPKSEAPLVETPNNDVSEPLTQEQIDAIFKIDSSSEENDDLFGNQDFDDPEALPSTYGGRTELINIDEELENLSKLLPNVPVQVSNTLLRVNGALAEGVFYKNLIILSKGANKGVAYHEAFHAVTQLYLSPSARQELYNSVRNRLGKNVTDLEAEEFLAEEFREYMLKKGMLKVPRTFKWLYDKLMDLINLFRSKENRLFSNIRAGRFDYVPVLKSSEILLSKYRLPFPVEFTRSTVDVITYSVIKDSGMLSLDRDSKDFKNIDEVLQKAKTRFQVWAKKSLENKDMVKAKHFWNVVEHWDKFEMLVKDELIAYNITERKDDQDMDEEFKSEGLNIKNSLTFSNKDNATGNTKLLVSFLPGSEKDVYFGLPRFVDFSKTWRLLENTLSGAQTVEAMNMRLEALSEDHPHIKGLLHTLKDPKFADFKKIQFYNAFSKQAVFYSISVGKELENDTYEWVIGNGDVQNQSSRIRSQWKEGFMVGNIDSKGKFKDTAILRKAVANFKAFYARVEQIQKERKELPIDATYEFLINNLNSMGIAISEKGLRSFVKGFKGSSEQVKLNNALDKINIVIANVKENISLEKMLVDPNYTWNEDNNFISDNSIMQVLAAHEANFSKIPGENSVLGPDGNVYQTKSQNNFLSKTVENWKQNPEEITAMRMKRYHKYSKFLQYLDEDPSNLEDFQLEVFLSNRVDGVGDQGTGYSDLTPVDEMVERITRTLNGVNTKSGLGSTFSPPTFSDKSNWIQMSGIPVENYGVTFDGENWHVSKSAKSTIYNYILAEFERIAHVIENPSTIANYETEGKNLYWFPELNFGTQLAKDLKLYDAKGKPVPMTEKERREKLDPYITKIIIDRIEENKKVLEDLKILESKGSVMHGVSQSIQSFYKKKNQEKGSKNTNTRANYELIADYTLNSIVANVEFTMMFTGDPAFYKDLSKRIVETIATGSDLIQLDNKISTSFTISVVNDIEQESELYNEYVKTFTKQVDKYNNKEEEAEVLSVLNDDVYSQIFANPNISPAELLRNLQDQKLVEKRCS